MLSPSDFNNAVPQFTNGNYASNPINPQYIAEPDAVSYNRGTEPLQTLPAQWWNWFLNKFTGRFNKVNVYVKNIFNELAQVLSIFNITPDGTEATPTTSQLKTVFECCYPQYVKTTASLVGTETTVNGHPLSSNVTVTRSDLGLGTSATVNTGTAAGCIPTVGTALGTTNNNILVTDASGNLKPSGITVGTAAGCDATAFRSSSWTPAVVCCAKCNGSGVAFGSAATCDASAFRASSWTPTCVACAGTLIDFINAKNTARTSNEWTSNGIGYYNGGSNTCGNPNSGAADGAMFAQAYSDSWVAQMAMDYRNGRAYFRGKNNGTWKSWLTNIDSGNIGSQSVKYACCASYNGSGTAFGSAATCAATAFLATNGCAYDSARLGTASSTCYLKVDGCTKVYLDTVFSKTPTSNNTNKNLCFGALYKDGKGTVHTLYSCICGSNGYYYGNICGNVCGNAASANTAYNLFPIFTSSSMSTIICCDVCLWADSQYNMYVCNKSKCGIIVSYFHCVDGCLCGGARLVSPATFNFELGGCWNCCSGSAYKCICVYMLK